MNTPPIEPEESRVDEPPTFDALPLTEPVRRAVDEAGWIHPTPVQVAAYEPVVEGKDLIVQARTGTGKTAAFGIPLVDRVVREEPGVQVLVLAPTRELALQSQREMERIGKHRHMTVAAVYGGAPMERQVRLLEQGAQIVSGTPGRVLDHLRRGTLDPENLRVLVLDEADEMLSMGFAKELGAIMSMLPKERQTLLFSATTDDAVTRMADRHMNNPEFLELSGDAVGALGVTHYVYMVSGKGRALDLVRILEVEDPESAIIFCNTRVETERTASLLKQEGFNADWLNGDLPQSEREKIMGRTRKGELRYLVATDVAARGIDVSHLTHVINFTLPEGAEQYIHRTGRTGRAGRTGTAISLVSPKELGTLYFLRLQYKIFPIERSLPTPGDERTRLEADRVMMLEEAFQGTPSELDRALARRVLTHPNAEHLMAGLLGAFFGHLGDDVDEQAAASRRSQKPAPAPEPVPEPKTSEAGIQGSEPESEPAPRRRQRRRARSDNGEATGEQKPSSGPGPRETLEAADADMATLYLNVGRRDGLRPGEVSRLLKEHGGLERDDIGRIRIRDKHTFVGVPSDRADVLMAALTGQSLRDRELVVELAKSQK